MKIKEIVDILYSKLPDKIISIQNKNVLDANINLNIDAITHRSNKVKSSSIFCALSGEKTHGMQFINEVKESGCKVVLYENWNLSTGDCTDILFIKIDRLRSMLGLLTRIVYALKDRKIRIIGVTGTTGKSSISKYIWRLANKYGKVPFGLISGSEISGGSYSSDNHLTTPEATDIGEHIYRMIEDGDIRDIVVECSSQGISYGRLEVLSGLLKMGVLSNIGTDHLDYHGSYARYAKVKVDFINSADIRIVNNRDINFYRYADLLNKKGLLKNYVEWIDGICTINTVDDIARDAHVKNFISSINAAKLWKHQAENLLMALSTIYYYYKFVLKRELLLNPKEGNDVIHELVSIPGRYEKLNVVNCKSTFIVDYAHTPDAIYGFLQDCSRMYPDRKVIFLFGCGGERDRYKRKLSGGHVFTMAKTTILTSDNPRGEDRCAIIAEILLGIYNCDEMTSGCVHIIPDRRDAIRFAVINYSNKNDALIIISGRGDEKYQLLKDKKIAYRDREFVMSVLTEKSRQY